MRALGLALCLSVAMGAASSAQDRQFENPSPVDFSRPFIFDPAGSIRTLSQDSALPVEVISREELLRMGNPTVEELVRSLAQLGVVTQGQPGYLDRAPARPTPRIPPRPEPRPDSLIGDDCGVVRRGAVVLLVLRSCPNGGRTLATYDGRRVAPECVIQPGEEITEARIAACGATLQRQEEAAPE